MIVHLKCYYVNSKTKMEFKEEEEDVLPVSFIVFLPVILLGIGFLSPNHIGIRASPVSP